MTETEKRRKELLEHTRRLYSEKYMPPAVHPRFNGTYYSLYKTENEKEEKGTFGIRVIVAALLFGLYVAAGRTDFNTEMVVQEIEQEFNSLVDLQIFD